MDAIRKILVPTDFSPHADEAFRTALALAQKCGADVVLFHIAQPPAVVSEGGQFIAEPGKGKTANLWDRFQHLQPGDTKVRVEHEVIVADRPSASDILGVLDKQGCDLIMMGTHGSSWVKQRLFGSVTEEVVRQAHRPVMVVKVPAPKAATPATQAPRKAEGSYAK